MEFVDKTLVCVDCDAEFEFPVDQQQRHAELGYTEEPRRCPTCRERRRAASRERPAEPAPLRPRPPLQFYSATCTECGQPTQVPFQPIAGRPVYCRACHLARRKD